MTSFLLDVNVLIPIIDAQHTEHARAKGWFDSDPELRWLSCPITQNGAVRILSNSTYSKRITPERVARSLRILMSRGNHQFVSDSISLLDDTLIDSSRLLSHAQITDTYLLALAAYHGACLATFDQKIITAAVRSDRKEVFLIP